MQLTATKEPTLHKIKRTYAEVKGFTIRHASDIGYTLVVITSVGCASVIVTAFFEIAKHEELIRQLSSM